VGTDTGKPFRCRHRFTLTCRRRASSLEKPQLRALASIASQVLIDGALMHAELPGDAGND